MSKNNLIERAQRCSMYTTIFFGYVRGRQAAGDNEVAVNQMAEDYIAEYGLEDVLDPKVIQNSYRNFVMLFRDIKRDENRRKSK